MPATDRTQETVPKGNTYDKYKSRNPVERYLVSGFFEALATSLPHTSPVNILEVGAGEGEIAEFVQKRYPNSTYTALDLPSKKIEQHWQEKKISGLFADMKELPFASKTFDLILAIEVFEHVYEPDRCLQELKRVGAKDFICSVPREPIWRAANMARGKYIKDLGNTPGHINHWSYSSFQKFMTQELTIKRALKPFPWTMISAKV